MALPRIKVDMHGDTSRWGLRAIIKHAASRLRRQVDKEEENQPLECAGQRRYDQWVEDGEP